MPLLIVKTSTSNRNCTVIIPAAGLGKRFGADLPKQYHLLGTKPLIIHTITLFDTLAEATNIIIPVANDWKDYLEDLLSKYKFNKKIVICHGGQERQDSIYNALNNSAANESDIVLVHDAVRPFASPELIKNVIISASRFGAAIPATMPKETIKQKDNSNMVRLTFVRSMLASVQTPQGFKKEILIDAYNKAIKSGFVGTDDASLAEHAGHKVKIIDGEETNIKITTPLDFDIAGIILRQMKSRAILP